MDRETWEEHHRTLGVELGASAEALKQAYRRLAKTHHPDAVQGQEQAKRRGATAFRAARHAYEALKDCPAPPPPGAVAPAPEADEPAEAPAPGADWRRRAAALAALAVAATLFVHWQRTRRSPSEKALVVLPPRLEAPGRPPSSLPPPEAEARRVPKDAFERFEQPGDYDYHTPRGAVPMRILPGTGQARANLMAQRRAAMKDPDELYFSSDTGAIVGVLRMYFAGESSGNMGPAYAPDPLPLDNGSLTDILIGPSPEGDAVDVVLTSAGGDMFVSHRLKAFEHLSGTRFKPH